MKITDYVNEKMKVDINNWKEFKIGDILLRKKIKSISSNIWKFQNGDINVIGNSSTNNGIIKKLNSIDKSYIHHANCLSYGAKGGLFFYQEKEWLSTDHVHMFVNEKLNKYNSLFLCSIINKLILSKGGWSSSLESNILNEFIKLPVTSNCNPDWDFMEQYIKKIYLFIDSNLNKVLNFINQQQKINITNWKEFKIGDLFPKQKIKKFSKIPSGNGNVAFISSQSTNNGIATFCSKTPFLKNAITVSTNGNNFDCFYHDYNFVPSSDVEVLINENLNKYNALFLCSILRKEQEKYSYGKKAKNDAVFKTKIKLPIDINGDLDWQFMEEYIKKIYEKYKLLL